MPSIAYLVTEDWYFLSHRLPAARAARAAGYEVHVLTHVSQGRAAIEAEGFALHALPAWRGSYDPLRLVRTVGAIRRHYRAIAPDIVHHVALQSVVTGSLAAAGIPCARVNAITGLGFVFTAQQALARLLRVAVAPLLRWSLRHPRSLALVENDDDRRAFEAIGVPAGRIVRVSGAGIDLDFFRPLPEPAGEFTIGFAGRLIEDKGLRTLIAAHDLLSRRGPSVRLLIAGAPDPANPGSIPASELQRWRARKNIELLGHVADIRALWARAHLAVLPSRREGLPMSLVEAAACGRAIVATDVPGCREVAREGVNALLVPPDDVEALADAIARLAADQALRARFGAAGRQLAEENFSAAHVGRDMIAVYDSQLRQGQTA